MAPFTEAHASNFARLALAGIRREYPNHIMHALNGPEDIRGPKQLHPAFYGCYDWHSSVHGHWLLARVLRLFPRLSLADEIRTSLAENLTADNCRAELTYFQAPSRRSFERPYGWAWLLKLAAELQSWDDPDARQWAIHLAPLTEWMAGQFVEFFPKQTYPIRTGTHYNTAFALILAHDFAVSTGRIGLRSAIKEMARRYYRSDTDYPGRFEPGGDDFLSGALTEAALMARVLSKQDFKPWFSDFLPQLPQGEPKALLKPATVADRGDPKIVHLDGLNLSRAWCYRTLASAFPTTDSFHMILTEAANFHAATGLAHVSSGDYAGEHWLATFAVLLLTEESLSEKSPHIGTTET